VKKKQSLLTTKTYVTKREINSLQDRIPPFVLERHVLDEIVMSEKILHAKDTKQDLLPVGKFVSIVGLISLFFVGPIVRPQLRRGHLAAANATQIFVGPKVVVKTRSGQKLLVTGVASNVVLDGVHHHMGVEGE
jgi:hypothetical protein